MVSVWVLMAPGLGLTQSVCLGVELRGSGPWSLVPHQHSDPRCDTEAAAGAQLCLWAESSRQVRLTLLLDLRHLHKRVVTPPFPPSTLLAALPHTPQASWCFPGRPWPCVIHLPAGSVAATRGPSCLSWHLVKPDFALQSPALLQHRARPSQAPPSCRYSNKQISAFAWRAAVLRPHRSRKLRGGRFPAPAGLARAGFTVPLVPFAGPPTGAWPRRGSCSCRPQPAAFPCPDARCCAAPWGLSAHWCWGGRTRTSPALVTIRTRLCAERCSGRRCGSLVTHFNFPS